MSSRVTTVLALLMIAGCGSSGGGTPVSTGGPSSGLSRTATLGALTSAEDGTLCDWVNGKQGGYGRSTTCPGGDVQTTDTSQAICAAGVQRIGTSCPTITVANVEDCANAILTDLCAFDTAAACAPLRAC